jgi:hypothetical protein
MNEKKNLKKIHKNTEWQLLREIQVFEDHVGIL